MVSQILTIGIFLPFSAPRALPQTQPAIVRQLLNDLPTCSVLREDLERGTYGDGVEQQYMAAMRNEDVKRAYFEVHSIWHDGKPTHIQVVHRLYFGEFDAANSQTVDPARLKQFEQSGLEATLDGIAREKTMQGHLFLGVENRPNPEGKNMYNAVELFANPWLPERRVVIIPMVKSRPVILHAAVIGDQLTLEAQVNGGKLKPQDINRALMVAVTASYDNSMVIKVLTGAGANVNFHGEDGITPLINAVAHPCNVRALLKEGADPSARDKWGRDALEVAREVKQRISVQLLEDAAANGHGHGPS